ncbi:(+)-neomenthol dehydrogenase [Eucalyptus grandis]|uniref:(+)-neomenthol dehydrogenase n=1 Tax=Eucalyptus grandis TaxID=71139 RepID=UPI00192E7A6F|nr:(+)-neomenthol dehydrogenase [Eucalyptus grandis]
MATAEKNSTRYAVVTGANKGIGLEICRQLASKGIEVILTARDKQRGLGAVKGLEESGISVIFHQLDVTDAGSIARLAEFIDTSYGRLDILVNNAGVAGAIVDWETFNTMAYENGRIKANAAELLLELTKQTYEMAEECAKVVYFGTKNTTEALLPLLLRSSSGRIVNVSASIGKLQHVKNEKAKRELNDIETLKKERLDEMLSEFLRDFKEDKLGAEGWPTHLTAYTVSKAAANAYTRLLALEHHQLRVNSVCPGFVKTDLNSNNGVFPVEDGARGPVMLALLPDDGPSGCFFAGTEVSGF